MDSEKRSDPFFLKFRPSIMAKVRADAADKGQPIVEWIERAALDRLRATEGEPAS